MKTKKFNPKRTGIQALLDRMYRAKFDMSVVMFVMIFSLVYTTYRSNHFMEFTFHLPKYISIFSSIFLETCMIAMSATIFISYRSYFIAKEINDNKTKIHNFKLYMTIFGLVVAFILMLGIAGLDAFDLSQSLFSTAIMIMAQFAQMLFVCFFLLHAITEEREDLLEENYIREEKEKKRKNKELSYPVCKFCGKQMHMNNLSRHEAKCRSKP